MSSIKPHTEPNTQVGVGKSRKCKRCNCDLPKGGKLFCKPCFKAHRTEYARLRYRSNGLKAPEIEKKCVICGKLFIQPLGHPKMYCTRACKFKEINAGRRDYCRLKSRQHYNSHKEEAKKYQKEWTERNYEHVRKKSRERYELKKDSIREYKRSISSAVNHRNRERRKNDPEYRFKCLMSSFIRNSLNRKGTRKPHSKVWKALGYTPRDLRRHLESFFTSENGFSWENRGTAWHMDHVTPVDWFSFKSLECPAFKACWSLSNIRITTPSCNSKKGNRHSGIAEKIASLYYT